MCCGNDAQDKRNAPFYDDAFLLGEPSLIRRRIAATNKRRLEEIRADIAVCEQRIEVTRAELAEDLQRRDTLRHIAAEVSQERLDELRAQNTRNEETSSERRSQKLKSNEKTGSKRSQYGAGKVLMDSSAHQGKSCAHASAHRTVTKHFEGAYVLAFSKHDCILTQAAVH